MQTGFIGAGKMAEALLSSMLRQGVCKPGEIIVSDVDPSRCLVMQERYGVEALQDNWQVVEQSQIIILAVKPQELDSILTNLAVAGIGKLFISIAAGKQLSFFEKHLCGARIVRVMPNLACQVGQGMSVYCAGAGATEDDLCQVRRIFESCGKVVLQDEAFFDVVTALSGSGPAFFAYIAKALADAAVNRGMAADVAMLLAAQTMLGTAAVLVGRGVSPDDFIAGVASKGGTTAAGLEVLDSSCVREALRATLDAATDRSAALRS